MKLQTIHTEHRVTDDDGDCGHMVSQSEDGGTKHHPYDSRATTEANHRRAAATHSALRDGSGARTWQSEQVTEYEKEMAARAAARTNGDGSRVSGVSHRTRAAGARRVSAEQAAARTWGTSSVSERRTS